MAGVHQMLMGGGGNALQFVGRAAAQITTTNDGMTLNLPPHQAGDLLVYHHNKRGLLNSPSTISPPDGWTEADYYKPTQGIAVGVYYRIATGPDTPPPFLSGGTYIRMVACCYAYRGADSILVARTYNSWNPPALSVGKPALYIAAALVGRDNISAPTVTYPSNCPEERWSLTTAGVAATDVFTMAANIAKAAPAVSFDPDTFSLNIWSADTDVAYTIGLYKT